jgi:hypothetical protein
LNFYAEAKNVGTSAPKGPGITLMDPMFIEELEEDETVE